MLYLISQITLALLVALAAGVLLGLALARQRRNSQADSARRKLHTVSDSTREELAYARARLKQLETDLDRLNAERMQWTGQWQEYQIALAERDAQLVRLQGEIDARQARLRVPGGEGPGSEAALRALIEQLSSLLERLPSRPAREKPAAAPALHAERPVQASLGLNGADPANSQDDLKRIHGIGPALERLLNDIGVSTYAQIASWSEEDIDRFQSRLANFSSRIRRDNWVEHARREHLAKYGEQI